MQLQIDDRRTEQDRQSRETREEQSLRLILHQPEESDRGHGAAEAQERQWHFNIRRHRQIEPGHHARGIR